MNSSPLHLDLPSAENPSVIPWIIVLAASAILLILINQLLRQIPATLQQQAVQTLSGHSNADDYKDIVVVAGGRDLLLSGNVEIERSLQPLVDELALIDGVQSITQQVTIVDPAAQVKEDARRFVSALDTINVSQVSFLPGSVELTPESDAALTRVLALLNEHPQGRIRIQGHTDNTGSDNVNLRVSVDRATAVANYLISRGISSDRLIVKGYGSSQPIADNSTDSGRALNRRIEISPIN